MPHKGYKQTPEHRAKIASSQIGKSSHKWCNMTLEQQQRNMEHLKEITENNKGKHRSPEVVKKIVESNRGKRRSLEFCQRMSEVAKNRKYSEETRKKMGESRKGEKNGMWRGGVSFLPYCPKDTPEFHERVRAFFKHTCQLCGHAWKPGEKRLAVHHVNYNKQACCDGTKPLFVPVCAGRCHSITNNNREYWSEIFTNKIMLEYDGECYLPKVEA